MAQYFAYQNFIIKQNAICVENWWNILIQLSYIKELESYPFSVFDSVNQRFYHSLCHSPSKSGPTVCRLTTRKSYVLHFLVFAFDCIVLWILSHRCREIVDDESEVDRCGEMDRIWVTLFNHVNQWKRCFDNYAGHSVTLRFSEAMWREPQAKTQVGLKI